MKEGKTRDHKPDGEFKHGHDEQLFGNPLLVKAVNHEDSMNMKSVHAYKGVKAQEKSETVDVALSDAYVEYVAMVIEFEHRLRTPFAVETFAHAHRSSAFHLVVPTALKAD